MRYALLVSLLVCTKALAADDDPHRLPTFHVTASRLSIALDETPGSTTTIDRDEIEALDPSSTAELLRGVPGLYMSGGSAGPAFVHLRGGDPNLTLVLIDGVPVNDSTDARGGAFDFDALDPSEIERIEIVRGPASSVHGSAALAGVVHIHTRGGSRPWASLGAGSDDQRHAAFGLTHEDGRVRLTARMQHREGGLAIDRHRSDRTSGSISAAIEGPGAQRFEFSTRLSRTLRLAHPDASGGAQHAILGALERRAGDHFEFGASGRRPWGGRVEIGARLGHSRHDNRVDSPGVVNPQDVMQSIPGSTSDAEFSRNFAGVDLRYRHEGIQLGADLSFEREDGENAGALEFVGPTDFSLERETIALGAEIAVTTQRGLSVHAGIRYDDGDDADGESSPRAGARYRLGDSGYSIKGSWGQGFKQPSFYALGDPVVGNESLESERSESVDAGLVWERGGRSVEATWFHTDYEDLIDFDFTTFSLVNRTKVAVDGFEIVARSPLSRGFRGDLQFSLASTEIDGSGEALLERPEWTAAATLGWSGEFRVRGQLRVLVVDDVPSSSLPTGDQTLDGYFRVDLSTSTRLGDGVELVVAIENLLDEEYFDAIGLPAAGIAPRVGVRAQF